MDNVELIHRLGMFNGRLEELHDVLQCFDLEPKQVAEIICRYTMDYQKVKSSVNNFSEVSWLITCISDALDEQ